jgi:hypothetical protein
MMGGVDMVVLGCLGGEKRKRRKGVVYGAAEEWWKGNEQ